MTTYKVLSDNLTWPQGSTIDDEKLEGLNVQALIDGGHIKPENSKTKTDKE